MTQDKFEEEYKKLLLPLGMFALRIIGDVDDSNDVVQSVFLKTWNKITEGDCPENLKTYLYTAVRNASLKFIETKARYEVEAVESYPEVTDVSIDTSERDARLWRAIESLPERCREIFLMCKRDGLSYRQVAEELSITEKTVENQMSKALKSLRAAYGIKSGSRNIPIFFLQFL